MNFFISAITDDGNDFVAGTIEAESFDAAVLDLTFRAETQFGAKKWRATSVVEQPAANPMRHYEAGAVHAETLMRRSTGREG